MKKIIKSIDGFSLFVGHATAWLTLAMVLITTVLVILRYAFSISSIAAQEVVMYMHATVFMLGAAYALQKDAHVRVDIFYQRFSSHGKAFADIVGTVLFLLPFSVLIIWFGSKYAIASWQLHEGSPQAGGLKAVYLLKTLLPIFGGMMFLQGIAEIFRNILVLQGKLDKQVGGAH